MNTELTNVQIVTLAAYLAGADSARVDTEDIAIRANDIAPARFAWRKYPDQINIEAVRKRLWDAVKESEGGYLIGSAKAGWMLTEAGLRFAKSLPESIQGDRLRRKPLSQRERRWHTSERARMLAEPALAKFRSGGADAVSVQEAEAFFRINDYVMGKARQRKLISLQNAFGDDPDLADAIRELAGKVRER